MKKIIVFVIVLAAFVSSASVAVAQQVVPVTSVVAVNTTSTSSPPAERPPEETKAKGDESKANEKGEEADQIPGISLPNSDRLRMTVNFMAAWANDPANAALGFEKQGRVGFVTVGLYGKLTDHLRYVAEINPVNETQPLAACGETNYFFPNAINGGSLNVPCSPDGRMRVDDYRFVALDPIRQQGMIRQAYLEYAGGSFSAKFGRFILPIGITWEETGAFSAKDTPHIARINSEANFGFGLGWRRGNLARVNAFAILGDGNRFRDYDYFYLLDGSMDSNSALTGVVSGSVKPISTLEVRGAAKFGYTGSKVERLPNFYASKRNDRAVVASVMYTPNRFVRVFGEYARYEWGLTKTSAELLGLDPTPVTKPGYFVGAEGSYPLGKFRLGGSVVREELSRDDSLVKLMADANMYQAALGKKERSMIYRVWLDTPGGVRVGWFMNDHSNPFPQLSGIVAVDGPAAYKNAWSGTKTGFAVQFRLQ